MGMPEKWRECRRDPHRSCLKKMRESVCVRACARVFVCVCEQERESESAVGFVKLKNTKKMFKREKLKKITVTTKRMTSVSM